MQIVQIYLYLVIVRIEYIIYIDILYICVSVRFECGEKKPPFDPVCMIDSCELIWESGLHQCQQFTVNRTHPESCWTERPSITAVIDGWTNHCLFSLSSSELRWFLQTDVFIHCRRPGPSDICNRSGGEILGPLVSKICW